MSEITQTADIIENQKTPHVSDGTTYMKPKLYKCKNCKKRLTSDEFKDGDCSGKEE